MNIALIGTPQSGKSELAKGLAERLGESTLIVDDYVPEIEERIQMALGTFGDYFSNLYVAMERYIRERVAGLEHEHVITCGTLIETAVYMAMHFVALTETMSAEEQMMAAPQMEAVVRMLAVLYQDIIKYDHAFYLPPRAADDDVLFMDKQLQAGISGFKLMDVTPLVNSENQLEDALAALGLEVPAA